MGRKDPPGEICQGVTRRLTEEIYHGLTRIQKQFSEIDNVWFANKFENYFIRIIKNTPMQTLDLHSLHKHEENVYLKKNFISEIPL